MLRRLVRKRCTTAAHKEAGFTLIELLVVILISGFLVAAMGQAIYVALSNNNTTLLRLAESHDSELGSRYFAGDVSAVDVTAWDSSYGGTITPAPATVNCSGASQTILSLPLSWEKAPTLDPTGDIASAAPATGTSLWQLQPTGTPHTCQLVRTLTAGTSSSLIVSHKVASVGPYTCTPSCTDPQQISMTVTEAADPNFATPAFSYLLTGTVRHFGAGGVGGTQPPPPPPISFPFLLALATSGSGVSAQDHAPLTVGPTGTSVVDSNSAGAVSSNRESSLGGQWDIYSPGTCTPKADCPKAANTTAIAQPFPDPLAALPAPPTTGLPTFSGSNGDQGCGIYTGTLSLSGGTPELNSANTKDCVYYLEGGFYAGGSATITSGSNGVLLYIAGGSFTVNGQAYCTLAGIQDSTSPYYGSLVFQARSDTNLLQVAGLGSESVYSGILYAPDAGITSTGNGGALVGPGTIGSTSIPRAIIAQTVSTSGNGSLSLS